MVSGAARTLVDFIVIGIPLLNRGRIIAEQPRVLQENKPTLNFVVIGLRLVIGIHSSIAHPFVACSHEA